MKKSHAVGWVSDSPTPAQLKEFFAQIAAGRITKGGLQNFLRGDEETPLEDPLAPFRKIRRLITIGTSEWEMAFRSPKGSDPLGLGLSWCPKDIPLVIKTPRGQIEITPELMAELVKLCRTREWDCTPVFQLELAKVGGMTTSLENQYYWWGIPHDDDMKGGVLRQDEQWSNWFFGKQYEWATEPETLMPMWTVKYLDFPRWSSGKNWNNQQIEVGERGLEISTAASDALTLNLVSITKGKQGKQFRTTTWARTNSIFGRYPLGVGRSVRGLSIHDYWYPEIAYDGVGASVKGVPLELVS